MARALAMLGIMCFCGTVCPQTSNTIVARFGTPPADNVSTFSVVLENKGPVTTISGFAFKIAYRDDQVSLSEVLDNTRQPKAVVEFGLGDAQRADLPNNTNTFRILTMSTVRNLTAVGPLAELVFEKQPGYRGRLDFYLEDRVHQPVDGLLGPDITNIAHDFDANSIQKAGR